jgi:hypothetical protein
MASIRRKSFAYAFVIGILTLYIAVSYNACSSSVNFSSVDPSSDGDNNKTGLEENKPAIYINGGANYTNEKLVNLTLEDGLAVEMFLSNDSTCSTGTWEPFTTAKTWMLLTDNARVPVYVKYKEKEGNETDCISDDIIHDDIAPDIQFKNAANLITADKNIEISWNASDNLSGVRKIECSDTMAGNFDVCYFAKSFSNMTEGDHTVFVRATDNAGNRNNPLLFKWMVDYSPPTVTINSMPSLISNAQTGHFEFSGSDAISGIDHFECRLDGTATWATCISPIDYPGLVDGPHKFAVRSYDRAGNVSTVASYNWTIDTSAPTVTITQMPPSFSNSKGATFAFTGKDDGVVLTQFKCKMDGGAYIACPSPYSYSNLGDGPHVFSVVVMDLAGNESAPANYTWIIDTVPPVVQFVQNPPLVTNLLTATFQVSGTDVGTGIDAYFCSLDGAAFAKCTTVKSLTGLNAGSHTFKSYAQDYAGNVSTTISYTWIIDLVPPVINITKGPTPFTASRTATFEFNATDAGSSVAQIMCSLDSVTAYTPCTSPFTYNNVSAGKHIFYARAVDAAGNLSDPKSHSWEIDLVGPTITFIIVPTTIYAGAQGGTAKIAYKVEDGASGVDANSVMCGLNPTIPACLVEAEVQYTRLPVGTYTFVINAKDKVGNSSTKQVDFKVTLKTVPMTQTYANPNSNNVDILFIDDNSGSMNFEQSSMAGRIGGFISKLAGTNWRIGIVTTDVRTDATNASIKDGRLIPFKGMASNSPTTYMMDNSWDPMMAQNVLGLTLQRPKDEGSGDEQGIHAAYRAIRRSVDSQLMTSQNRDFFRANAALSVILISDEEETPIAGNMHIPQDLLNYVKTTFNSQKNFTFHSIITVPGDKTCLDGEGESYGYKYQQASQLTDGIVASVCEANYTAQLQTIGQRVADSSKTITLNCAALDLDNNGIADVTIMKDGSPFTDAYTSAGVKLTFANPLPVGNYTYSYSCVDPNP